MIKAVIFDLDGVLEFIKYIKKKGVKTAAIRNQKYIEYFS